MEVVVMDAAIAVPRGVRPAETALPLRYRRWWDAAAVPFPCIIVGVGRWGKVLAGVLGQARGGGEGIHLVARSNTAEAVAWAARHLPGATVAADIDAVPPATIAATRARGYAVVASEPSRHFRDWTALRGLGLPVLVEKPLAADPAEVDGFVRHAAGEPVTGVGIEFAMQPVWACLAGWAGSPIDEIAIAWSDPADEIRHGEAKRRHAGVSLAADLSYHVASILNHFCDVETLAVVAASSTPTRAWFAATGAGVRHLRIELCSDAPSRQRRFAMRSGAALWEVDFGSASPVPTRDGRRVEVPAALRRFDSSLRLELGAFHLRTRDSRERSPLTDWLAPCAAMHRKLVAASGAGGRSA